MVKSISYSFFAFCYVVSDIDAFTPVSDDELMLEYLFHVFLEYEEKIGIACKPPRAYNIYKVVSQCDF